MWDRVFFGPSGLIVDFGVVLSVVTIVDFFFFFAVTAFFIVVAVVVIAFSAVFGFGLLWWVRVAFLHNRLVSGTCVTERSLFNGFDTHELIGLRVSFFLDII